MKENLNQITEIYAKKPVKAVVLKNNEKYQDNDDERIHLPDLSKSVSPNPEIEYSSINIRQNVNKNSYSNSNKSTQALNVAQIKLKNHNKGRNSRITGSNENDIQ
jgi:hypothetical protein